MTATQTSIIVPKQPSVPSEVITHQLACELATGLYNNQDILDKFELTVAQLKRICKSPQFRLKYQEAKAVWESSDNVQQRIRQKSALLLEDSVLPLYSIIHNTNLAPAARTDAFSKLMAIADMQPSKDSGKVMGDKFTLNITIGDEKQSITIEPGEVDDAELIE
jgi:hypothetical protein